MPNETEATGLLTWIEFSGDVGDWTATDALNDPRMWDASSAEAREGRDS